MERHHHVARGDSRQAISHRPHHDHGGAFPPAGGGLFPFSTRPCGALALEASVGAAVVGYEAVPRPATAAIVQANRQVGPERCMDVVEERAPDGFGSLDAVISQAELLEISRSYKRTAGFDPDVLNRRPSLSVR